MATRKWLVDRGDDKPIVQTAASAEDALRKVLRKHGQGNDHLELFVVEVHDLNHPYKFRVKTENDVRRVT